MSARVHVLDLALARERGIDFAVAQSAECRVRSSRSSRSSQSAGARLWLRTPLSQDLLKGGAVETGCSGLHYIIY